MKEPIFEHGGERANAQIQVFRGYPSMEINHAMLVRAKDCVRHISDHIAGAEIPWLGWAVSDAQWCFRAARELERRELEAE